MNKKILFITGTRADFGKLKPLIQAVGSSQNEYYIFATGMHTHSRYGYTVNEIYKTGLSNIHVFVNQIHGEPMDMILANTIHGLSRFIHELKPDMIVVHGDRVETLAGAIVGALNNILVAHIEGGEVSGTIDELIRHSVSKLSHLHFVSNKEAADRLIQLGERQDAIFVTGSPDIDIMLSDNLPNLDEVKTRYGITFDSYAIVLLHPITTELNTIRKKTNELVSAVLESRLNYVVIYPNNDQGCNDIFAEYVRLEHNAYFRIFPSMRFEYFLALLKNADFIIGNSSAGVREAPVYGVYSINIGTRQKNRFKYNSIINVDFNREEILNKISEVKSMSRCKPSFYFGDGNSAFKFISILDQDLVWDIPKQKQFCDL